MPQSNSKTHHVAENETSIPMQPVVGTDKLRPVPSLNALEQHGGPELDGPLILPDDAVWSSRFNEVAEDFY